MNCSRLLISAIVMVVLPLLSFGHNECDVFLRHLLTVVEDTFRSKLSMLPQGAAYSIAQVCDCKERWLKIRIRGTKDEIVGWLPPENQCVNMYSMCCGN